MKISLVITTYNWPEALNEVFKSITRLTCKPDEIVIADDGSKEATKLLIELWTNKLDIPVVHSWQEDNGYRLSQSRNRAIAKAQGDYIIMIDGDMVLAPKFIEDHFRVAERGFYIQGWRVKLTEKANEKIFNQSAVPSMTMPGIEDIKNRLYAINSPLLQKLGFGSPNSISGTKGCNMAFWRDDVIKVNGFNEEFIGWGKEDNEFATRMINTNLQRKKVRFGAIAYHLYHREISREMVSGNQRIYDRTRDNGLSRCEQGIDSYL